MDHEEAKIPEYGKAIGACFKLEIIDLSGNKHLNDEFFMNIFNVEIDVDKQKLKPGLADLHTVKLNMLDEINDITVSKFL